MEEVGYSAEQFKQEVSTTNRVVFSWLRWADPEETIAAIDKFYETYDIRIFAPSHTNVIRKDLPRYLDLIARGHAHGDHRRFPSGLLTPAASQAGERHPCT